MTPGRLVTPSAPARSRAPWMSFIPTPARIILCFAGQRVATPHIAGPPKAQEIVGVRIAEQLASTFATGSHQPSTCPRWTPEHTLAAPYISLAECLGSLPPRSPVESQERPFTYSGKVGDANALVRNPACRPLNRWSPAGHAGHACTRRTRGLWRRGAPRARRRTSDSVTPESWKRADSPRRGRLSWAARSCSGWHSSARPADRHLLVMKNQDCRSSATWARGWARTASTSPTSRWAAQPAAEGRRAAGGLAVVETTAPFRRRDRPTQGQPGRRVARREPGLAKSGAGGLLPFSHAWPK